MVSVENFTQEQLDAINEASNRNLDLSFIRGHHTPEQIKKLADALYEKCKSMADPWLTEEEIENICS